MGYVFSKYLVGTGKKVSNTQGWFRWKSVTTFERHICCKNHLIPKELQKGNLSSLTRLADVIATKKYCIVCKSEVAIRSNSFII